VTTPLPDPALLRALHHAVRRHFEEEIELEQAAAADRKAAIVPLVREAIARARAGGLCRAAWLFGSYAWGEPGQRSDVDILVEGRADTLAIASLVGRACGLDVHVVDEAEAPESLKVRVAAEGLAL
jgi:predicted nucleotidyltransferase